MKNLPPKHESTRKPPDREHCAACGRLWTEHTDAEQRNGCKRQPVTPMLGRYLDLPLNDWAVAP